MVRAWAGSTGGGEATTESRAREDTDHVVLGGEHPEETAGGLVQISRHPGGLDGCQVSPGPVHHRGEDGEASELSDPPVEDLPARRADEHREQDGSPASAENQTGVLVLVGEGAGRGASTAGEELLKVNHWRETTPGLVWVLNHVNMLKDLIMMI